MSPVFIHLALHIVLAHLLDECRAANIQPVGGTGYDAATVIQRLLDKILLQIGQIFLEI